jgi:hypothetical protein
MPDINNMIYDPDKKEFKRADEVIKCEDLTETEIKAFLHLCQTPTVVYDIDGSVYNVEKFETDPEKIEKNRPV